MTKDDILSKFKDFAVSKGFTVVNEDALTFKWDDEAGEEVVASKLVEVTVAGDDRITDDEKISVFYRDGGPVEWFTMGVGAALEVDEDSPEDDITNAFEDILNDLSFFLPKATVEHQDKTQ